MYHHLLSNNSQALIRRRSKNRPSISMTSAARSGLTSSQQNKHLSKHHHRPQAKCHPQKRYKKRQPSLKCQRKHQSNASTYRHQKRQRYTSRSRSKRHPTRSWKNLCLKTLTLHQQSKASSPRFRTGAHRRKNQTNRRNLLQKKLHHQQTAIGQARQATSCQKLSRPLKRQRRTSLQSGTRRQSKRALREKANGPSTRKRQQSRKLQWKSRSMTNRWRRR